MQASLRWLSTGLFVALGFFLIAFGALYASVTDYLPFHGAAIAQIAQEPARPLYLALMKLIGGASAALGVLGLYVTLMPMRRGVAGAASLVSLAYAGAFLMAAYVAQTLAQTTGAPTSWHIMGVLLAITAAAYGLHWASARSTRR